MDASLIEADANKSRSVPGVEWNTKQIDPEAASRGAKEYIWLRWRMRPSTTLAEFSRAQDSQITFSVTHGWSAFGGADHGWQDVGLER